MKRILLPVLLICAIISSCTNIADKEIDEMAKSGVVLVQNSFYYELTLSNGSTIYFSAYDKEDGFKDATFDSDSIKPATSFGTGFFISSLGEIATNNHVVAKDVDKDDLTASISDLLEALKSYCSNEYDNCKSAESELENIIVQKYYNDEDYSTEQLYLQAVREKAEEYADTYHNLNRINPHSSRLTYHNEVSIAYNDTYVTNEKDLASCVVTKTDPEHDLAIIQLKNKVTPAGKYVFEVPQTDPLEDYTWDDELTRKVSDDKNDKLFMISFNLGPQLATTREGIKSQFNNGTISQQTNDRLMYSIPTLPGSSGSPVVNHKCELVAVNFAGINNTQNFNYGIRVKHLRNLISK